MVKLQQYIYLTLIIWLLSHAAISYPVECENIDPYFGETVKKYNKKIEEYKKKLDKNPYELDYYYEIAASFEKIGKYEEAVNWYKDIIKRDLLQWFAIYQLGKLYTELGKYEQALKMFDKVKEYTEYSYDYHILTGKIYFYLSNFKEAHRRYQHSFLEDKHPIIYALLADYYMETNNIEKAKEYLDYIKKHEISEFCYIIFAKYYIKTNNCKEAIRSLEKSLKQEWDYPGKDGIARCKIAAILNILKVYKEKIPSYADLADGADYYLEEKNNSLTAYVYFYLADLINPNNANLKYKLGICNLNLKDLGEARKYFERYIYLNPEGEKLPKVKDFIATFKIEAEKDEEEIIIQDISKEISSEFINSVEKRRGLKLKKEVPIKLATPGIIKEILSKKFANEYSEEKLKTLYTIATRFGFLPEEVDKEKFLRCKASSIAGVYFNDDNTIYIYGNPKSKAEWEKEYFNIVLAHELIHALQDQNFDIMKQHEEVCKKNEDICLAYSSIIEGDAKFIETLMLLDEYIIPSRWLKDIDPPTFEKLQQEIEERYEGVGAPTYLGLRSVFPYIYGFYFVIKLWQKGGYKAINEALTNPPLSTEQIIHPEKYIKEIDLPSEIIIKELSKDDYPQYKLIGKDTMGEFNIFLMFKEQYLPTELVYPLSAGWDGDRYLVYETEAGDILLLWVTIWDTEKDAKEFFDGYKQFLKEKSLSLEKIEITNNRYIYSEDSEIYYAEIKDKIVTIIEGATEENIKSLMDFIWENTEIIKK